MPASTVRVQNTVLVVMALLISAAFLWMIREFLIPMFLAALAAGMFSPVYAWLHTRLGGRPAVASGITVGVALLLVIAPATAFLGVVGAEAVQLSQVAGPWVQTYLSSATELDSLFDRFPVLAPLEPYRAQILSRAGAVAGEVGAFVFAGVAAAARETASFFLLLFVMLYAMFFFLMDGTAALRRILYYLPLESWIEARLVERFLSVSRATLKGTLVIGIVQGALGGLAFWVAGLDGVFFWAAVMAVLSTVPGIGAALVWVPAVGYLAVIGRTVPAVLMALWFAGVVGSVDNLLRPSLIGKDTKMPDLLILLGTLGGIVLFGPIGFLLGPIVTALFLTVWEIYGETFRDVLPAVDLPGAPRDEGNATPGPSGTP
jgi:predicted PurR-regulated permease PerM